MTFIYERLVGSVVRNFVCTDGHLLDTLTPRNIILACFGVTDLGVVLYNGDSFGWGVGVNGLGRGQTAAIG